MANLRSSYTTFSKCVTHYDTFRLSSAKMSVGSLAEGVSNTKLYLIFDTRIINLRLLFLRDITNCLYLISYNSKCYCNHTKKSSLFCIKTKPYIFITIRYLIMNKFRFLQTEKLIAYLHNNFSLSLQSIND